MNSDDAGEGGMKLKSYFSSNVEGALRLARMELGPDAMIVQSRKTTPETRHLGECEVIVAVSAVENPEPPPEVGLAAEVADLRRRLDRMTRAIAQSRNPAPQTPAALVALLAAELPGELARDIYKAAAGTGRAALAEELASRFSVDPELAPITAFAGPCGSGKTTTIAKLAAAYGIALNRPPLLISMDGWRINGAEQLRSFAAILGLPCLALETPAALAHALEEHRARKLILIDTPGHSARDIGGSAELAAFLAARPDIDVHLTLSASMKAADLTRVVDVFRIFGPVKLLFTRLDETGTFGPIAGEAIEAGLPVSFFCAGQQVPEDIEPASKARLTDLVLGDYA